MEPLRKHLAIVSHLTSLTEGHIATHRLAGRALRIVSESANAHGNSNPPLDMAHFPSLSSTQALIQNLSIFHARGGHFEFFRSDIDAPRVAGAILSWLGEQNG